MSEATAENNRVEASSRSLLWGTSWTTLYTGVNILAKLARGLILPRFLLTPLAQRIAERLIKARPNGRIAARRSTVMNQPRHSIAG